MTVFDYAVIIIVGLSIVIGISRGLIQEVLSILGWFAALYVAKTYAKSAVSFMPDSIPGDELKMLAAFLLLFIATLFITGMVAKLAASMFSSIGLGWLNNVLGAGFGFLRGVLIAGVIVFLAGFTKIPEDSRWQGALLSDDMEQFVLRILEYAPASLRDKVHYPQQADQVSV